MLVTASASTFLPLHTPLVLRGGKAERAEYKQLLLRTSQEKFDWVVSGG